MITPFERYCFNHLPFGITSTLEYFQKHLSEIFQGVDKTVCLIDDILVYGKTQKERDKRLTVVLQKIAAAGVTLNTNKWEISQMQVKF